MLLIALVICLSGCSLIEVEITGGDVENYSDSQTLIDDSGNLSEDTSKIYLHELISVNNSDVVSDEDRIWSYYYDDEKYLHFVLLDTNGVIIEDKKSVLTDKSYIKSIKALSNDYVFINGSIGNDTTIRDYVYDLNSMEEITDKFINDNEKVWCIERGGNFVIKSKTEETYNDLIFTITVMDEYANVTAQFSSTDFESKYERNWYLRNPSIYSADNGIYVFNIGDMSNIKMLDYMGVIDCIHKKIIIVNKHEISRYIDANEDKNFEIYSDGEYLAFFSNYMGYGNYLFDLINEKFVTINDGYSIAPMIVSDSKYFDKAWKTRLSDDKVYCINRDENLAFENVKTGKMINIQFDDAKPSYISPFINGYAVVSFKNQYVTVIDENGSMLFDPIEGHLDGRFCFAFEHDNQIYFSILNSFEDYLLTLDGRKIENINGSSWETFSSDERGMACRFLSIEGSDAFLVDYNGTEEYEFSRTQIK